jgi:hypothetical protein
MRRLSAVSIAVLLCALGEGCYSVRVAPPDMNAATQPEDETVHSTFWGLWSSYVTPLNCQGNALAEVFISSNLGYSLVSVLSLGFWAPARVTWTCAKDVRSVTAPR